MPAGTLVTVPEPDCVSVNTWLLAVLDVKVALTVCAAESVMTQAPVPEQAPPQPLNWKLAAGVAVRAIAVAAGKLAVQLVPQLIPAGLLVTLPLPVVVTVSAYCCGPGLGEPPEPPEPPPQALTSNIAAIRLVAHFTNCRLVHAKFVFKVGIQKVLLRVHRLRTRGAYAGHARGWHGRITAILEHIGHDRLAHRSS